MKQLMIVIIVIIIVLMDSAEGQYSNCNDSCPTGKYVIITCSTEGILGKRTISYTIYLVHVSVNIGKTNNLKQISAF